MFNHTWKNILFVCNTCFILGSELMMYGIFRDYAIFIDRLTTKLASINILYVKIFQAFALNHSFIDDNMNNQLLKFTNQAPWQFSDIDRDQLRDVADKYGLTVRPFQEPINAGMISLVFKLSKHSSDEKVIIKMKRKNIQQQLDEAIDNLLFFIYIVSFIPIINTYQLSEVVTKNIEIIRHQTNFLEEVDNMSKMRDNCKNLKYIKIPLANRQVTEEFPNIIYMEYIEGMKIEQILEADYKGFAKCVVKFGLVTTMIHGVTHGDLHSGNVLFIKDEKDDKHPYKLGVIDFGIIYEIDTQYKGLMFDVITNLFETSPRESAEKILNSDIIEPHGIMQQIPKSDYESILCFAEQIVSDAIQDSKKANQMQIYKFLSTLKEYLSKEELVNIGIRPSDNFVKSQLVLAMAHGVTLKLCNDEFVPLMDEVLNELFHTQLLL